MLSRILRAIGVLPALTMAEHKREAWAQWASQ